MTTSINSTDPVPVSALAPPRPPGRRHPFFWGMVSGCLVLFGIMIVTGAVVTAVTNSGSHSLDWTTGDKVAVVPLEGEIADSRELIEQLHRYAENDSVKAMVVRINSPGGAIVPSQEISEEIGRIRRDSGKPIIASMDSVAASGGYYVAVACDRIVANPGTITGSIGVITQWFNVGELMKWAHVEPQTITSGAMKDVGSPYRAMTDVERTYMQGIVSQLHDQFIRAVAAGRRGKMTESEVRSIADGRVFTGETALHLKLIDEIGNLQDAIRTAGRLGGIKGEPKAIYPKRERPGLLDALTGASSSETLIQKILDARAHQFLYRW